MALGDLFAFSEFTSDQGVTYKLSIYDSEYSNPSVNHEFTCGGDGFVLTYKGEGDERYQPIKASNVEFQMNVPSISSELYSIINNLQSSDQGRYKLKIERSTDGGTIYNDFWHGIVIADIAEFEDVSFPSFYKFTAVDGLSLMKDVKFDSLVYQTNKDTLYTFANIISNLLRYYTGGVSDFFGASDTFTKELCHWYEDTMPTPASGISPLRYSATYPYGLVDIEYNDGDIVKETPISAYKAIESILQAWGLRIWQQDGYWWLAHVNMWADLPNRDLYYRRLDTGGNVLGFGTHSESDFQKELGAVGDGYDITKLSGSIYSYLPEIHEVTATYENWTSAGMYSQQQNLTEYSSLSTMESNLINLGYVEATTGAAINITQDIKRKLSAGGSTSIGDWIAVVYMIKVGSYYWSEGGWTTTQSAFSVQMTGNSWNDNAWVSFTYPAAGFTTDDLPVSGNLYYIAYKDEGAWGSYNGITNDYDVRISAQTIFLPSRVQYSLNGEVEVARTFSSSDASSEANEIVELGDMRFGDGPTTGPPSWGRIRVSADLVTWENSVEEDWQAWETGSVSRITQLLCEQALQGQREFVPLNNYNIILRNKAAFRFGDALDDNTQSGNRMVANGWKLTANKDEVNGEFWKASQDTSGITNSQTSEQSIGEQWWPLPDLF